MLKVKGRHFELNGKPFFYLADTAWLLFSKLTLEETKRYLETRAAQGFNVIHATLVHHRDYHLCEDAGRTALQDNDFARPSMDRDGQGYWDRVEEVVKEAGRLGLHMGLVLSWGTLVQSGALNTENCTAYLRHIVSRFSSYDHVIYILGGDIRGSVNPQLYRTMGRYLKAHSPNQLVGYHPFGRCSSSLWFRGEAWLDFHMFQSGHRDRSQRTLGAWDDNPVPEEEWFGEENWKYVERDRAWDDKPTLDGEPSYEGIPHGLHDPLRPYWTAREVRRYCWWSLLSGAAGFTYGHNATMQFYRKGDEGSYGVRETWQEALMAPGAGQMRFARELLEKCHFEKGVPRPDLLLENGEEDTYVPVLASDDAILAYSYPGTEIQFGSLPFTPVSACFFDPASGDIVRTAATSDGRYRFPKRAGDTDWVLVLKARI